MTPEEFRKAERKKMRLQADIAARRNSLMTTGRPDLSMMLGGAESEEARAAWNKAEEHFTSLSLAEQKRRAEEAQAAWRKGEQTLDLSDVKAQQYSQPSLPFVSGPYQRQPQTRTNPDARSVNPHGDPGLWDSLLVWPGTEVLWSGLYKAGKREGEDTVRPDGSVMRTAGGQGLREAPTYGGLRVLPPGVTAGTGTVIPRQDTGRPEGSRAAADATIHQNQADILGTPGVNLNAENARRIAATTAHNNTMRPGRIADANARLLPKRGFSQGALDSLHEPPQQPPTIVDGIPVYPGAKNAGVPGNRSWLGQYLPDSWRQRNFNQQARDEQTHGEGQRFRGDSTSPWVTSRSTSPSAPRSAAQGLTDAIKLIKKRKAIIAGSAALVGGDKKAADRYEAKALASLGIYAGRYALSNLDDADFQGKRKLFQALLKNGMPVDQVLNVIQSGVVETGGKKKFVNWTDGTKTISLREGQQAPPGYWVGKLEGGSKGNSMRFIDEEGVGHLGYVQHDENGIPRNFLMDGSPVPLDWDMVSPIAPRNKTEITNNLGKQGEKMGEARQIAMAKMSQKWSNDAAAYFFDSSGRFKADRLDIFLTSLDVPGEGRLAWTQMKNALAAALRLESGAAIGVEEAANYKERFFPKMTDTEKTIIWKLRAFNDYVRALETINNPQWVYENLPHPAWNPKKVRTQKERDALPHGSYFTTPNGNLGRYVPNQTEAEVLLQ